MNVQATPSCILCICICGDWVLTRVSSLIIGATVEAYCDEKKNFLGLFFQDRQMKQAFDAYPEFICLDATYKLLELGFPVYLMVCEDANGQSEIIAVCLLASEDADSIRWMIEVFMIGNMMVVLSLSLMHIRKH